MEPEPGRFADPGPVARTFFMDEIRAELALDGISGCLGPCDPASVLRVISRKGLQWFGGLREQWQYDLLLDWATASREAGVLLESPAELNRHRFERFAVGRGALAQRATATPAHAATRAAADGSAGRVAVV